MKASEWVNAVSVTINGKGGGKDTSAQAIGTNVDKITEAVKVAKQYADSHISQ